MKNHCFSLLSLLLPLAAVANTNETVIAKVFKTEKTVEPMEFIQYNNRVMVFTPAHIGYERIKPNAMYVGVEVFKSPIFNRGHKNSFVDAELRVGHNFFYNDKDHFSPFVMLGTNGTNPTRSFLKIDYRLKNWGMAYGGVGFLYTHEFDPVFNMGINLKLLVGGSICHKHKKIGSPSIGTDVAVPLTFRFGRKKHWDFRLEPFFFGLHGQGSLGYFGWRNSVGYRF